MLDLRLDLDETLFQRGTFSIGLLGDHALHPRQLLGIEASQILEAFILGHIHISCSVHLPAARQHLARAEEGCSNILAGLPVRPPRQSSGRQFWCWRSPPASASGRPPRVRARGVRGPLLSPHRPRLCGPGNVQPAIHPARGLEAHAILFRLLDHGEAEVAIVEAMVPPQEKNSPSCERRFSTRCAWG